MKPTAESTYSMTGVVADLSRELEGKIELPAFPDIAIRLNQALRDENAPVKDVVALINSEPALVSRLLKLANSAAFNSSNVQISEIRMAVARLGFNMVWSAAASFAMRQVQQQEWLQPIRPWLAEIWLSSNGVAAICFVLAKKLKVISADEAMTVGLFHRVGDLWLLTRAQKLGVDLHNDPRWDQFVAERSASVAAKIVRQWGLPDHVADAIDKQDSLSGHDAGDITSYVSLLSAAKLYNGIRNQQGTGQAAEAYAVLEETRLWGVSFLKLVAECHDDIESMRQAIA